MQITNYALIKELDIAFRPGFNIITGETGAGKSILLGALNLILGQRADTSVLKDNTTKCLVEGTFSANGYRLESFFEVNDLDYDEQIIMRREISAAGKSRAFINDTPVSLSVMKQLGIRLIDIHSQHQNLELGNHLFQLNVLDAVAGHETLLEKYREVFKELTALKSALKALEEGAEKVRADLDYFQFQFQQLDELKLREGEQEALEEELKALNNSEEIKGNLSGVATILNGDNTGNVLIALKEAQGLLGKLVDYHKEAAQLAQRTESAYYEMQDIASEAGRIAEQVEYNPERIEEITQRLDAIYMLQQKHRAGSVKELIELRDQFEEKIRSVTSCDNEIATIKTKIGATTLMVADLAEQISGNRKEVASRVEQRVEQLLRLLGMLHVRFEVKTDQTDRFSDNGRDTVSFLFSANKNVGLQEVSKIASGGEISRVMLAVKSLLSKSKTLPTIIFDEIDTGVSGEIAGKMGGILRDMSEGIQLINITHLPQVAGKGHFHYLVYKKEGTYETVSDIRLLDKHERVVELAKMLSGEQPTEAAISNAKELLGVH